MSLEQKYARGIRIVKVQFSLRSNRGIGFMVLLKWNFASRGVDSLGGRPSLVAYNWLPRCFLGKLETEASKALFDTEMVGTRGGGAGLGVW